LLRVNYVPACIGICWQISNEDGGCDAVLGASIEDTARVQKVVNRMYEY
jgi:hypothetical protein